MIKSGSIKVNWGKGVQEEITHNTPKDIMHDIAERTLMMTFPTIPELTGKMKQTSLAHGVQGSNMNYTIGSYTNYASYVYVMPKKTNWTTPGTNAYWFNEVWVKHGKSIVREAVERNKLK